MLKAFAPADEDEAFRDPLLRRGGGLLGILRPAAYVIVLFLDFDARLFIMEICEKIVKERCSRGDDEEPMENIRKKKKKWKKISLQLKKRK